MVAIDPSSAHRRSRVSLCFLTSRLIVILAAVASGVLLVRLREQLLFFGGHETVVIEAPAYYNSGIRNRLFDQECRYYLAKSAIPNGGLGVFSAKSIVNGELFDPVGLAGDICIYVPDLTAKTDFRTHSWSQDVFFGQFEGRNPRAACEGFATLFNSLPQGAQNSKLISPRVQTNAGLNRRRNPGAGAITHYFGIQSSATDNIQAGSELTIVHGDDFSYEENTVYTKPERPLTWLREHGMCIDNIEIRPAADPQMGRGAFATRHMRKGVVVAPAPLQTFRKRSDFVYGDKVREDVPESLFVNYNFQPNGTEMMLFPYGPGVNLINHNGKNPNVAIRWSSSELHHSEWLELAATEFWDTVHPGGLILEVVAVRDIKPGEELFMDYGRDWEKAWKKHVEEWQPPPDSARYVYPAEMDETFPLRTVTEQLKDPYPPNLAMVCITPDWERIDGNQIIWYEPEWEFPEGYVPCHVLRRQQREHGDYFYKVLLDFKGSFTEFNPSIAKQDRFIDVNVPRHAIRFVDKPYTSDQHLKGAFRHPIAFPDKLVPDQWRTEF